MDLMVNLDGMRVNHSQDTVVVEPQIGDCRNFVHVLILWKNKKDPNPKGSPYGDCKIKITVKLIGERSAGNSKATMPRNTINSSTNRKVRQMLKATMPSQLISYSLQTASIYAACFSYHSWYKDVNFLIIIWYYIL